MSLSQNPLPNLRLPSDRPVMEYPLHMRQPMHHEISPTANFYLKSPSQGHLNVPYATTPYLSMPTQALSANPSPRQSPRLQPQASLFQSASKNILPGYFFPNMSSPKNNSKATLTNVLDPKYSRLPQNFTSNQNYSGTHSFIPSMELENEYKGKGQKVSSIHDAAFNESPVNWNKNPPHHNRTPVEMDYNYNKYLKNGYPMQPEHDGLTSQRLKRVQKSCDERNFLEAVKGAGEYNKMYQEELPFIKAGPQLKIHELQQQHQHFKHEEVFQKSSMNSNPAKPKISAEDMTKYAYPQVQISRPASKGRKSMFKYGSQSQGSIVLHDEEPPAKIENYFPLEKKNSQQNPVLHHFDSMKTHYDQQKSTKFSNYPLPISSANEIVHIQQHHRQIKEGNPLIRSETYKNKDLNNYNNSEKILKTPYSRPESKEKQVKSETRKMLEKIRTNIALNDQTTIKSRRLSIEDIKEPPGQSKDFRIAQEFTKSSRKTSQEHPGQNQVVTHFSRMNKPSEGAVSRKFDIDDEPSPIFAKRHQRVYNETDFVDEVVFDRARSQQKESKKLVDILADLDALDTEPSEPRNIATKPRYKKGKY